MGLYESPIAITKGNKNQDHDTQGRKCKGNTLHTWDVFRADHSILAPIEDPSKNE